MNKKIIPLVTILIIIILINVFSTYAFYQLTKTQDIKNNATTGMLSLRITKENKPISLEETFPISDEEADNLQPFEFTITNDGDMFTYYTVNLESLAGSTLNDKYIASKLDNNSKKILSSLKEGEKKNDDSVSSRTLVTGGLNVGESVTYNLRLWIDSSTTLNEETTNKNFEAKVVIIANSSNPKENETGAEMLISNAEEDADNKDGLVLMHQPSTYQLEATDEYRYVGATPNNYIKFNNQTWRIIGIFNVDNGEGILEKRIKIMKDISVGKIAYDSAYKRFSYWPDTTIRTYLNGTFYNSLSSTAKNQIAPAKFYIAANDVYGSDADNNYASSYYKIERGNIVRLEGRAISWVGNVGLIYPSDFGFATGGATRGTCLNINLFLWSLEENQSCYINDWIYNKERQWTMTPHGKWWSSRGEYAYIIDNEYMGGGLTYSSVSSMTDVYQTRPVVFLKSDIKISGKGTYNEPYIIVN
ncbi:MAG: DUF6273 domain-containing protein [Bacilli bacterium]